MRPYAVVSSAVTAGLLIGLLLIGLAAVFYPQSKTPPPALEQPSEELQPHPTHAPVAPARSSGPPPGAAVPSGPVAPDEFAAFIDALAAEAESQDQDIPPLPPAVTDAIFDAIGHDLGQKTTTQRLRDGGLVTLYQQDGQDSLTGARIDLDEDGEWDETWAVENGIVRRQISLDDDSTYSVAFLWTGDSWLPAPTRSRSHTFLAKP